MSSDADWAVQAVTSLDVLAFAAADRIAAAHVDHDGCSDAASLAAQDYDPAGDPNRELVLGRPTQRPAAAAGAQNPGGGVGAAGRAIGFDPFAAGPSTPTDFPARDYAEQIAGVVLDAVA